MNGYRYGHGKETGSGSRGRLILMVLLPTAFLGITYFLLIEYLLQGLRPQDAGILMAARVGGGILVALSLIVATAGGYLLVDRILRPLRVLVRLVQGGDVPDSRRIDPRVRCSEISELYRVVGVLVRQNQAGAKALEELEELRNSLSVFREEIVRTGQHGIPPSFAEVQDGPLAGVFEHIQRNRSQLMTFFGDLRDRVQAIKGELNSLATLSLAKTDSDGEPQTGPEIGWIDPIQPPTADSSEEAALVSERLAERETAVGESIERLRRLGTVLTLDVGASAGTDGGSVGRHLENYLGQLAELENAQQELMLAWKEKADRLASMATDKAARAVIESIAADNAKLNNEIEERLGRLTDSLESLDRRLGEVEDR